MTIDLRLREVTDDDLPVFYEHQLDAEANRMAAFTPPDPADREAFDARWKKIRADEAIVIRTVLVEGAVAGSVLSWPSDGRPEVSLWFGREHWGRGIATRSLAAFLEIQTARPLRARAAKDNAGSIRVLEKCGFRIVGEDRGFANARGEEIEEWEFELGPERGEDR